MKLQRKKIIVFNIQTDYFYNIFEPVYLALLQNPKIQVFFAVLDRDISLKKFLRDFLPPNRIIPSTLSPFICFDLFITADINGPDLPSSIFHTPKIQMYHGVGVYPLYHKKKILSHFNIHFAIGPQFVEFVKTLPHNKKNQNNCELIGYPKLDALFEPSDEHTKKLRKLYDIGNNFVILYTPHWNPYGSLHLLKLDMLEELAKLENVKILIKVHHFLFTKYEDEKWETKLQDIAAKHENVIYVTRPNTQEIFPLGDMLITDTGTTAAFEFSVTKKPVFVFYNQEWFENNQNTEVERTITQTAINFTTTDEILDYVIKLMNNDSEFGKEISLQKEKQEQMIKKFLYNPGCATIAALDVIKKILRIYDGR